MKSPATTDQVRIRITGSRLEPTLAELGLFRQSVATLPPTISDRSTKGTVSLSNLAGKTSRIAGFTYLPRQDGLLNGVVEKYRFETSANGATWTTNIADGSFANIQNNPSLQEVAFAPVSAHYFRFTSLRAIWGGGWTSAAEISVLPAGGSGD